MFTHTAAKRRIADVAGSAGRSTPDQTLKQLIRLSDLPLRNTYTAKKV